jgi:hypothetical protein
MKFYTIDLRDLKILCRKDDDDDDDDVILYPISHHFQETGSNVKRKEGRKKNIECFIVEIIN